MAYSRCANRPRPVIVVVNRTYQRPRFVPAIDDNDTVPPQPFDFRTTIRGVVNPPTITDQMIYIFPLVLASTIPSPNGDTPVNASALVSVTLSGFPVQPTGTTVEVIITALIDGVRVGNLGLGDFFTTTNDTVSFNITGTTNEPLRFGPGTNLTFALNVRFLTQGPPVNLRAAVTPGSPVRVFSV
jgi:hypothetical protein